VVEDDPHSLEVTCQILQREGYRSQAAATGQEALDLVAEGGIDAVLLDMSLPDISGLEVVKEIRKKPGRDLLPVIGVTGHAGSDQAALCREAGCSAFVEKPVKWKALLGQLADLLSSEGPVFTPLVDGLAHLESKPVGERGPESGVEEEAPSKDSDTAAA
jgi:CheY-like chemotaxis protein